MSYLHPRARRGMGSISSGPRGARVASIALSDDATAAAPTASSLPAGQSLVSGTILDPNAYGAGSSSSSSSTVVKVVAIAAIAFLGLKVLSK